MYKVLDRCLCCDSSDLVEILDLGPQPLANSYRKSTQEILPKFPLVLNACETCSHLQLSVAVDPDLMFKEYLYVSGTSATLRAYFKEFADYVKLVVPHAKNILDIACNDGSQLDAFKQLGLQTFGVDPAENLHNISSSKGHRVACNYFNKDFIKGLGSDCKFDIITAQNVFAHNDNPYEFLLTAKQILSSHGSIFIQTSQGDMIDNNEFDTIYHEHISFFNMLSMSRLAKRAGFFIRSSHRHKIHGNSYIFELTKYDEGHKTLGKFSNYDISDYINYAKNVHHIKNEFTEIFRELDKTHYTIGCGAAAKGNTFLNFCNIEPYTVIDENPLKQNLYLPGQNSIIRSFEECQKYFRSVPVVYIPLAWNFYDEIKTKITKLTFKKNFYLKYFPKVEVVYE